MHVLATKALTLDEADVAVDLGQTPADIVVLSFSDSDLSALAAGWRMARDELPTLRLASLKRLRHPMSVDLYIDNVASKAKAIVVRALGGLEYWRYGIERLAAVAAETGIVLIVLPGCDKPAPHLMSYSTAPHDAVAALNHYLREGGAANAANALRLVATLIGHETSHAPPQDIGPATAMREDQSIATMSELIIETDKRPFALVTFYRAQLMAADTAPMTALLRALATEGFAAAAVAVTSLKDRAAAAEIQSLIEARPPAIILNATAFSALREDQTSVLDAANVPVLQVVLAGSTRESWSASPRGLSPTDMAMNVVLPELDGRILTRAISVKEEGNYDSEIEFGVVRNAPLVDRIAYVAELAANWARLSRTPPAERRVAMVLSDYPARAGRAGYAVGLDTAASAAEILVLLRGAGYDTGVPDWSSDALSTLLEGNGERLLVPLGFYERALAAMPEPFRLSLDAAWGPPSSDPALKNGAFQFTVLRSGQVIVALQPDRGARQDRKQSYHDIAVPPRHAYVAFYAWLREVERIGALIHLGTHGTLEWLPGKAVALSEACAPEAVLGPLPVIYPFIVNNPGEAVQAKRRLGAVTIGHLTPPLSAAGLHGPLADLETLIEEYAEADGIDRRRITLLETEIVERAWRSGLAADCGLSTTDAPRDAVTKLDAQLCDIKELAVREHLHVFGRTPGAEPSELMANAIAANTGLPAGAVTPLIARSAECERTSLLAALDGKRVPPGPAGAPSRGRADVLPTGRNLTTVDPRAIPTPTAAIVGARAAKEVVSRYLQDHGEYPTALVIDLWASASLRTGGDDLAQALAYLGVRPIWDPASGRVTGVEVIPEPKLERPRIDVTLRISGLFRDLFASQIALFEMAIGLVASLAEDDAWNPIAAARRRGESLDRVFGAAPGAYGAATADLALDGNWYDQSDLGKAYLESTAFSFGGGEGAEATPAGDKFERRILASDALIHAQDDRERDLLDGDGVADFAGGYAAAAAMLGRRVVLYHLDTSKPEAPRVRTVPEEITRIVRGRLTNPRWIEGMLAHGYRGVAEIAQSIDALYAFQASARCIPDHLIEAVHDAILADVVVADRLKAVNPAAADAIARRMEDLITRRLWTPRRNAVAAELEHLRLAEKLEAAQ